MANIGRMSVRAGRGAAREIRYWVRASGIEVPLEEGQTLIGRGEDCDLRIRDHLVSRHHARIIRQGDTLFIQDLGSANGILVNQQQVDDAARLLPGDQVFIGTCELVVFCSEEESDRPTNAGLELELPEDRETPTSMTAAVIPTDDPPSSRSRRDDRYISDETQRADGLEYMGRLADKMFTVGRTEAAVRILGGHLHELVESARGGRTVEPRLVDVAGRYAMKLAAETLEGKWIDLAIELHIASKKPMIEETIQQLAMLRAKAPIGDAALLSRYETVLRGRMSTFTPTERTLVERIACLR